MIQKQFDHIKKDDIEALITDKVLESKSLEYKQGLPGNSDNDKKEFLADVSSFGNASGGDIIYGVKTDQKTRSPEEVQPISGIPADPAKLRLEEMIRNGIEPRLRVQIKEIGGWGAEFVILIRINKSFSSPHMVTFKGASRFYSRNSAGKYQLDVNEIRTAFLASESQAERIKQFREDRLGKILADETPVVLSTPHRLVLHIIPVTHFLNNEKLDLTNQDNIVQFFKPISYASYKHRYNLDGFVTWRVSNHAYCQLFFNGVIEAVYSDLFTNRNAKGAGSRKFIASIAYERHVIKAAIDYLKGLKSFGVESPFIISMALLNCKDAYMYVEPTRYSGSHEFYPIDRDVAILPDVAIDSLDIDVGREMKPIFDAVWNACGFTGSLNYDDSGNWNPRN